jgi:hypothetical protein
MHPVRIATVAAAALCLSSFPALSDGSGRPIQAVHSTVLAGIDAVPLTAESLSQIRGEGYITIFDKVSLGDIIVAGGIGNSKEQVSLKGSQSSPLVNIGPGVNIEARP